MLIRGGDRKGGSRNGTGWGGMERGEEEGEGKVPRSGFPISVLAVRFLIDGDNFCHLPGWRCRARMPSTDPSRLDPSSAWVHSTLKDPHP